MKRIALDLLKIANTLDDLELHFFAGQVTDVAEELLAEAELTPLPAKQPLIQTEPINQNPHEKEAIKEFSKDKKDKNNKKTNKEKGIVEGRDYIVHQKSEG